MENRGRGVVLKWPLFQILGPVCPLLLCTPTTHTNFHYLTLILPGMHLLSSFHLHKDGDQRESIVYCSSVMVWKQPSAGPFDICGCINQGCHTAYPPPPNPNRILSLPLYSGSPHPVSGPPLPNLNACQQQQ